MTSNDISTIASALATTLSAFFLWRQLVLQKQEWKQNKLANRIAVIFHEDFWHKKSLAKLELVNTGNTTIIIHHFLLRNKNIKESKSWGGSSLIDDLMDSKIISLKPGENFSKKVDTDKLPTQASIFVEIRYKSSLDNFQNFIFFEDEETRVIK